MDAALHKLTIACPASIEAALVDCLDNHRPELPGYTLARGDGRGSLSQLASAGERVRGAMKMILVLIILPEADVPPVLEAVRRACPRPNIAYWIEPVLDFGRLQ